MRLITILLILCAIVPEALAQSGRVVVFTPESLYEAIDQNSSSVKLAALAVDDAQQGVEVAKTGYLPTTSAAWQVGYLGNGYLTDRNFSAGMPIHNPHFVNNFSLEAMQLIYAGGAVSQGVKMAELRRRMAEMSLDESRQQVRFVLLSKLIDVNCLNKQREVISQNLDLADQVLAQMRLRNSQGLLLENDITRYELQISNLQLQRDRIDESLVVINASIATALGYGPSSKFQLKVDGISEDYQLMPLLNWQELAKTNSLAMSKTSVNIDMSKTQLRLSQAERLPHIGAFAYGSFNSPITIEVPVINKNFMYWGFGINVSYNISSLFKTNRKLKQAKIGIAESEMQREVVAESVSDQVTQAYQAFLTAQSQLRTQKYSLKLANQNYEIVSSRFAEGMALVTDLVDAANVKVAAQTGVENAQSQLLFCLYKLKYISNTL